jgi:hypothetical protein
MASAQQLKMLKRALRCYDVERIQEIVMDYLEERGLFSAWWEDFILVASASEAGKIVEALKELFKAAGIGAEVNVWSGDEPGSVKIGLDLPWGQKREDRLYKSG